MTKMEFLQQLYNHLSTFSPSERDEIIQDFEEHFSAGIEMGKTEEQICDELGTPYSCAMQYANQPQINAPEKPAYKPTPKPTYNSAPNFDRRNKFLWRLMFIFLVMCALGVYPSAVAMIFAPIIVAVVAIFAVAIAPTGAMIGLLVSLSVALTATGLLMFSIMTWLLKLCYKKADI